LFYKRSEKIQVFWKMENPSVLGKIYLVARNIQASLIKAELLRIRNLCGIEGSGLKPHAGKATSPTFASSVESGGREGLREGLGVPEMYLTGHNLRSCTKQTSKLLRSLRGRGNC
jgi:hypothetical protein